MEMSEKEQKEFLEAVEKFISEQKPAPYKYEKYFMEHWEEFLA